VSPSLRPIPSHPLGPSFPHSDPQSDSEPPNGHHPASPRFLLSLLATAVYLSIPIVASQALNLILTSVSPWTVMQYLNFSLGKPIENLAPGEPEAAVGLEGIAQMLCPEQRGSIVEGVANSDHGILMDEVSKCLTKCQGADGIVLGSSDLLSSCTKISQSSDDASSSVTSHHYGSLSDKIGEAAACWLARWAPDMLSYEEQARFGPGSADTSTPLQSTSFEGRAIRSSTSLTSVPTIWARGGLDAKWVCGLVSSDALFVSCERERYDFARRVVELRRLGGVNLEEETVWTELFSNGIYYANMVRDWQFTLVLSAQPQLQLMEDIVIISHDRSPTTCRPYVPLDVLKAANWSQSLLRHQITRKISGHSPALSESIRKDLGLTVMTRDIVSELCNEQSPDYETTKKAMYHPVPPDSSVRLGDDGSVDGKPSMDQLFEISSHVKEKKTTPRNQPSEANFFGLGAERRDAFACVALDPDLLAIWTSFPPIRFAVEFWNVGNLKEKSRLFSHTIWYAGSLFNVYVQVMRKKGFQLGVYLHRQSTIDRIPASSAPLPSLSRGLGGVGNADAGKGAPTTTQPASSSPASMSVHTASNSPPSRSSTPTSSPSTPMSTVLCPALAAPVTPPQPYRDQRASIRAYFTVSCASATGNSLTRFTSAPDVFSVGQSWGWKSSYLRTEEYVETSEESPGAGGEMDSRGRTDVSFRATVVMGLV
jgi:hypothetical protein